MKRRILLSSIAIIMLCLCVIGGSTFALFTHSTDVNVSVVAGKVEVKAAIDDDSLEGTSIGVAATKDANGVVHFANGGTATLNGENLVLNKITPGDFVNVTVSGTNTSNVAIRYRYVVKLVNDSVLASALTVKVDGVKCVLSADKEYYASEWILLPTKTTEDIGSVEISVGLDAAVGNADSDGNSYHGQTVNVSVVLEAIQGNGFDAEGNPLN